MSNHTWHCPFCSLASFAWYCLPFFCLSRYGIVTRRTALLVVTLPCSKMVIILFWVLPMEVIQVKVNVRCWRTKTQQKTFKISFPFKLNKAHTHSQAQTETSSRPLHKLRLTIFVFFFILWFLNSCHTESNQTWRHQQNTSKVKNLVWLCLTRAWRQQAPRILQQKANARIKPQPVYLRQHLAKVHHPKPCQSMDQIRLKKQHLKWLAVKLISIYFLLLHSLHDYYMNNGTVSGDESGGGCHYELNMMADVNIGHVGGEVVSAIHHSPSQGAKNDVNQTDTDSTLMGDGILEHFQPSLSDTMMFTMNGFDYAGKDLYIFFADSSTLCEDGEYRYLFMMAKWLSQCSKWMSQTSNWRMQWWECIIYSPYRTLSFCLIWNVHFWSEYLYLETPFKVHLLEPCSRTLS